jgi:D-alanyl-lipoteichoic acid acyltransferase DltB (MBOAT superfamily)
MVFNSLSFALFLGAVYGLFLVIPARFKGYFLTAASYVFYSFTSYQACAVLAAISLLCYWGGYVIRAAEGQPRKQLFRLFSIIAALITVLIYFKFIPFLLDHLDQFTAGLKSGNVILALVFVPVGISYYLFQGIGYLIDVYWGKPKEEKLGDFLLFMSFFPKVMMGPIERGEKLLPQIKQLGNFRFDPDRFQVGLLLFFWGLFKKLVVAERLALYVNDVYRSPAEYSMVPVIGAMICFAFQLYSDFSGYTDMALGVGKLFGLELTQNFNRPFYATHIQDFWRRWHVSFTSWIADYFFTPLRMNLRSFGKPGLVFCLFATFILVGAWHGTGWTFIIFGVIHGSYVTVSTFTLRARDAYWKQRNQLEAFWLVCFRRVVTFGLVVFSLVFFRANTVADALGLLGSLFRRGAACVGLQQGLASSQLMIAVAVIVFMEITEKVIRAGPSPFSALLTRPAWQRWAAYSALLLAILCFGVFTGPKRFIYFAF